MADLLTEFLFPERGVRGAIVEIRSGIDDMLGWRAYSHDVRRLLMQVLAAMPLFASHAKFEGRMNLQFQGQGALQLLVAQIDRNLKLRGMAKASADAQGGFDALMQGGRLALMLEPERGRNNYQAMVEIRGASLAEALEGYFDQSEQLPTRVQLAAGEGRLVGILLQRMPARSSQGDDANWEHLSLLFATLREEELASTAVNTLLHRLFHEEDLRVFEARPVRLACSCSPESIARMLVSLGWEELEPAFEERGVLEVTCEFCGRIYRFDRKQLESLFAAEHEPQGRGTRH